MSEPRSRQKGLPSSGSFQVCRVNTSSCFTRPQRPAIKPSHRSNESLRAFLGGEDYRSDVDPTDRLQASLRVRHVRAFRRLLWTRLALMTVVWVLVALLLPLSSRALVVGIVVIGGLAGWALAYERQAIRACQSHEPDGAWDAVITRSHSDPSQ